jgi:hypothetical protein
MARNREEECDAGSPACPAFLMAERNEKKQKGESGHRTLNVALSTFHSEHRKPNTNTLLPP